jgi:DNA-binding transcriptional LysR family regulator
VMLTQIDLNRLRVFYFVFLQESTVGAANELAISRSAVSQQLKKLEYEINAPLFTRLPKRLVPTAEGKRLFDFLKPFFQNLDQGILNIHQSQEKPAGLLKIGAPVEFGKKYFPGIIASYQAQYPDVIFHLKLGNPSELLPMVSKGTLDFGFVDMFSTKAGTYDRLNLQSVATVFKEVMVLACSNIYYNKHIKGDHSFLNLHQKDFIAYQEDAFALQSWFQHHFQRTTVNLRLKLIVDSVQAVIEGIMQNMGLAVVASHLVSAEIGQGKITPIAMKKNDAGNVISIFQLKGKIPNLREKTFQKYFIKSIAGIDRE